MITILRLYFLFGCRWHCKHCHCLCQGGRWVPCMGPHTGIVMHTNDQRGVNVKVGAFPASALSEREIRHCRILHPHCYRPIQGASSNLLLWYADISGVVDGAQPLSLPRCGKLLSLIAPFLSCRRPWIPMYALWAVQAIRHERGSCGGIVAPVMAASPCMVMPQLKDARGHAYSHCRLALRVKLKIPMRLWSSYEKRTGC